MDENKKLEIKNLIISQWDIPKQELCNGIMMGYIFGPYATNEHYIIDEINSIYNEVYVEKNPIIESEENTEPVI